MADARSGGPDPGGLEVVALGVTFQNPVLLASGTCGFGREVSDVLDLEGLGGFVTKSVTLEPRGGNPAPRVAELTAGMINSVGLANPGAETVRRSVLPWIRTNVRRARVFVSVAGHRPEEYFRVVEKLDGEDGFLGFEVNLSCPNDTRLGGLPFALDRAALREVVSGVRARTRRPLLVKLAPNDPDVAATAASAEDSGADGLTLVNTLPGLALDEAGAPLLGAGPGGMSGPALRGAGVLAVWKARRATRLPLVGVGGILSADDALEYFRVGATLVQVGTATFADPRAAGRVIEGLRGRHRPDRTAGGDVGTTPTAEGSAPAGPPAAAVPQ